MKKSITRLFVGLLTLVLVGNVLVGSHQPKADNISTLEEQIAELESKKADLQAQREQLQAGLSEQSSKLDALISEKSVLEQEIFLLGQQEDTINEQISAYNLLIADKQEELDAAKAKLNDLQVQNRERIRAMEKDNGLSYWSVLFRASSFTELLDQMRMISQIHQGDQDCLDALEAASQEVEAATQALTTEREAAEATRQELTTTQAELEEKQKKSMETLEELLALGDEYRKAIEETENNMDGILSEIDDAQAQLDWEKYQEWLSTSVPETTPPTEAPTLSPEPTQGTEPTQKPTEPSEPDEGGSSGGGSNPGGWVVPVDYVYISSPFGTRVHPITGVVTTHYGVDLAAYLGNPIYATRSGVVTQATYGASGGYYVYIDHGDGFTSIYLHMTHYIVSAGDYVEAGQVIGYCGSTGASTGPHLHFGLIYNGAYVDPTKYVNLH